MYKKNFFIVVLILAWSTGVWAQNPKGAILFFPDQQPRPEKDQFEVRAGQEVEVCVKLEIRSHPLLQTLSTNTTGFRLVLEDEKTPPNAIVIQEELKKDYLKPDARGCYVSRFQVPPLTEAGVYQAADLLFQVPGRGYLSIHQMLYEFSQADELRVVNPESDSDKPSLIQISTLQEKTQRIGKFYDFYKIEVKQDFAFGETGSGLAPESLKIYYRLLENGERTGIYQADCRRAFKEKTKFHCKLELTRPQYQWELSQLTLQLESIYLQDKAGNQLVLADQELFKKASPQTPVQFDFEKKTPGVPRNNPNINRLQEGL